MSDERERIALGHIQDRIAKIQRILERDPGALRHDEVAQAAVIYHLHVIGEATTRLSAELKARHSDVGWSGWRGFRLVSTHFYENIDVERVEKQMERALPAMSRAVTEELARA